MSGHVNSKLIKAIDFSTGSLGNGLGVACGYAYSDRVRGVARTVAVLISDGELNEGSTWEAMLFAAHHRLHKVVCILDANGLQSIKGTSETLKVEPIVGKVESFGWNVVEINGHDHEEIERAARIVDDRPLFIVARTTKGKGVSFMEDSVLWHYRSPQGDELREALLEVEG